MTNRFLCPECGNLAARDLSTLDYDSDVQHTECGHCGEALVRRVKGGRWTAWARECEGHYDDDRALTSGAGIGEPVYCDGGCQG